MPVACICAYKIVLPTNLKPRFFRSLHAHMQWMQGRRLLEVEVVSTYKFSGLNAAQEIQPFCFAERAYQTRNAAMTGIIMVIVIWKGP